MRTALAALVFGALALPAVTFADDDDRRDRWRGGWYVDYRDGGDYWYAPPPRVLYYAPPVIEYRTYYVYPVPEPYYYDDWRYDRRRDWDDD